MVKRYRCRLVRVLYDASVLKPVTGEVQPREVEIIAKRAFIYDGHRYRRGSVLTVSSSSAGHFISTNQAVLK